jgi:hypothetical protein
VADELLKAASVNSILEQFWADLPHADIQEAITPDVICQLYQGLVKHLLVWLEKLVDAQELDAWFKHIPLTHGIWNLRDTITSLT